MPAASKAQSHKETMRLGRTSLASTRSFKGDRYKAFFSEAIAAASLSAPAAYFALYTAAPYLTASMSSAEGWIKRTTKEPAARIDSTL